MASEELKALSIANSPQPEITDEGQAAKERIAENRRLRDSGMSARDARIEMGTVQPTISATDLATPVTPVNPPMGERPEPSGRVGSLIGNVTRDTQGFITNQSEEAQKAREIAREMTSLSGQGAGDVRSSLQEEFQIPQNLRTLQDINLQLAGMTTEAEGRGKKIARKAGQTITEGGRGMAQNQAELDEAIYMSGLAARAAVLQGSIETASTLVNQAMGDYYNDAKLQNANMIQQLNYFSGIADQQTSQLLTKEARKYEQENFQIEQAVSSVNSATASGFATQEDISTMTALAGDPQAQKEYADKIIAKGSRAQYLNALAATRAAANAARANAANEVQGQAAAKAVTAQTALDVIDVIKNNPLGIKAIAGANRFGRTGLSTALEGAKTGFAAGTAAGAIGGSVIPGAGTLAGGALGGVTGFLGGAGVGTYQAGQQRADVASALGFLTNSETFAEMRRLREKGVTFGSLTEGERVAIGKSADALFSAMEVDQNGAVTGVLTSEAEFNRLLDDFQAKQKEYLREANAIAAGMSEEDMETINNL